MRLKFASIKYGDKHAYCYDSEQYYANHGVKPQYRMFETYGDGLTQHSGDWPVTFEYLPDFLMSAAAALLERNEDTEKLAQNMTYELLANKPKRSEIEFAASVVFKPASDGAHYEKKRRYYSVAERKVTTSESKEYDKRYSLISDICDGTPKSIFYILRRDSMSELDKWQLANAVYDWQQEERYDGGRNIANMQRVARFLGWTEDYDKAYEFERAFETVTAALEAWRMYFNAQRHVESYQRNVERAKEEKAVAEQAVA